MKKIDCIVKAIHEFRGDFGIMPDGVYVSEYTEKDLIDELVGAVNTQAIDLPSIKQICGVDVMVSRRAAGCDCALSSGALTQRVSLKG